MYIKDDAFASYKLLRREFEKIGYNVSEEFIKDRCFVTFISPTGRKWKTSVSQIAYPFNSQRIKNVSINKEIAYEFAQKSGVSIPFTYHISETNEITPKEIADLLGRYGKLIVKPADSSLSRGLTLNIQSPDRLLAAIVCARAISSTVLIQEQVEGEEIRFVVINGKVAAALLRRTPRIVGDGVSTVAELINKENDERKPLNFEYITYPLLSKIIIEPSLMADDTLLPSGEVLELSRATMIRNGASVYNVLDQVHPSYIESIEKLVAQLGAKFIVVDIFFKDFTSHQQDHNYWFIEFNTSPVLKLFYGCRDGKMFDIVPSLVNIIDKWLHKST
ncbi:hypothetical protein H7X69_00330 [Candidatus Saccharibacteria bacterium]|nr:hypothetical protein [Candidatus Saccharibacteria bacterium]